MSREGFGGASGEAVLEILPTGMASGRDRALVLCGHGSRGGVGSAAGHAAAIRALGRFAEVQACALKGRPGLRETLAGLARRARIDLVPMLMAEGYTLRTMLRQLDETAPPGARLHVSRPVGSHPGLAAVMAARAAQCCAERGWAAGDTGLLMVGHGTRRDPQSGATAHRHALDIARSGRFAEVGVAFLDEAPGIAQVLAGSPRPRWVAVGLFADHGEHGELDVPRMLAKSGRATTYTGAIGADGRMVDLILEQLRGLDGGSSEVALGLGARGA